MRGKTEKPVKSQKLKTKEIRKTQKIAAKILKKSRPDHLAATVPPAEGRTFHKLAQ